VTAPRPATEDRTAARKKRKRAGAAAHSAAVRAQLVEELERERRGGRWAGVVGLLSIACWVGALMAANAGGVASQRGAALGQTITLSSARQLLEFHRGDSDQVLATGLRCAGLLLTAGFGLFLYRLVRSRRPAVAAWLPWLGLAGAVLVGGATVFGYFALHHVANTFAAAGPRTSVRARDLIHGSGAHTAAAALDLGSRAVLGLWVVLLSRQMMHLGLLDRFLAYWGFGAGAAIVVLPIGDAMFVAWVGSVAVLALGYWPGGRPEAWTRIVKTAA
jgi:hypothetical protein